MISLTAVTEGHHRMVLRYEKYVLASLLAVSMSVLLSSPSAQIISQAKRGNQNLHKYYDRY